MSNLSDLIPAGGGQNNTDFVADGGITSGKPVILNADGTVSGVSGVIAGVGSESVYESAASSYNSVIFDSDSNKVVAAYKDGGNSSYGTAVVGTVSGTSISWGTPVVFESAATTYCAAVFDSDSNKVVISYNDGGNSQYGTSIVGTVSGTSISFGTAVVFHTYNSQNISATFDSTANKVVIAYTPANTDYGNAIVGTVSGTSISFGTAVVFEAAATGYISAVYDSNADRTVIAYMDDANSDYGTAVVGTVSGTAISFGTVVVFNAFEAVYISATYDSTAQKIVISYMDGGSSPSNKGTAIVGTVSGTTISFGTEVVFNAVSSNFMSNAYDANANKVVIAYQSASKGYVITGTISGTSISFGTPVVFNDTSTADISAVYNSTDNKIVVAYTDTGNSDYGTGIVFTVGSTNLTASNLLGVASGAILDTATGTINTWGSRNEVQTSLTIASDYYAQEDGTITTSDGGQLLGKALSATMINIKDYTG